MYSMCILRNIGKIKKISMRERVNINALHSVYSVLVCVQYAYHNEWQLYPYTALIRL